VESVIDGQAVMKIHVSQVPKEGVTERASCDPAALDLDRDDIKVREPIDVEAVVMNVGDQLVVRATIRATLAMTCARWLAS